MDNPDQLRVLVIDDSRDIREFVVDYILVPHGIEVDIAVDGAEGLDKALTTDPDLILIDYEMPEMNGLDVVRHLRERDNKVPVILMTSHGSEQLAVEVFRLGVHDYVIKPFSINEMLDAIENALSVARLRQDKATLTRKVIQANQQLERRLHELRVFYRIGKSITSLMHPDKLLERVVDAVMFLIRAEEVALVLVDPETGQFKKQIKRQRSPAGEHVPEHQWETIDQMSTLVLDARDIRSELNGGKVNILSVPMKVGPKIVGTLSVSKEVQSNFSAHDEQLLRMLADYSAIALHNIELMHQLHATKEREKQHIRGLFERYVASSVVEKMLAEPEQVQLGGSRQTITVLFADVRGFSTFSASKSPEFLVELLNKYMRVAADAVLVEEGTLDKFMGDAVMAFFNAPFPQPDHPLKAIRAACELRNAVAHLHEELDEEHCLYFGIGVGIGEAVVGNIGTPQLMNYTVIGDSVNKVKRLQENAKGGQILISQETYYLVQDQIRARSVGNIHLKGQSKPEMVYEVIDLRE